jgi:hypothetical protein
MTIPKDTQVYAAYIAGVLSAVTLAYFFWRSQVPPPQQ